MRIERGYHQGHFQHATPEFEADHKALKEELSQARGCLLSSGFRKHHVENGEGEIALLTHFMVDRSVMS